MHYTESEVRRIGRVAFEAARKRNKRLCSVDKMNVLETTQLWRDVMIELAPEYPDVELTHMARYFAGGLNGGTYNSYGKLIAALCKATDDDPANNVVARWHDESHLNKYVLSRHDLKVLSPSYLFPEGGSIPFEPKVIIKDKKKYGGHDYLRGATTGKKRGLRKFRD